MSSDKKILRTHIYFTGLTQWQSTYINKFLLTKIVIDKVPDHHINNN